MASTETRRAIFIIVAPARIFPTAVLRNRARRRVMATLRTKQKNLPPAVYRFTLSATTLTTPINELRQEIEKLLP